MTTSLLNLSQTLAQILTRHDRALANRIPPALLPEVSLLVRHLDSTVEWVWTSAVDHGLALGSGGNEELVLLDTLCKLGKLLGQLVWEVADSKEKAELRRDLNKWLGSDDSRRSVGMLWSHLGV